MTIHKICEKKVILLLIAFVILRVTYIQYSTQQENISVIHTVRICQVSKIG